MKKQGLCPVFRFFLRLLPFYIIHLFSLRVLEMLIRISIFKCNTEGQTGLGH